MNKLIGSWLLTLMLLMFGVMPVKAQEINSPKESYYKARILEVVEQGRQQINGFDNPYQILQIKFLDGDIKGQIMEIEQGQTYSLDASQLVKAGETVVIVKTPTEDGEVLYQIIDRYRLDKVLPMILFFFLVVLLLSKWQGVGSILGMIISLGVIVRFIVPGILMGRDPLLISIIGCLVIMLVTIYLAHGFSKKTSIALLATFLTLVATGLLATLFVQLAHLTGLGTEDAYSLRLGMTSVINFKGLLLGGMLIGALGVLDDVTTGLSASVFELAKANPKYGFKKLFESGLNIGREHVASLVNTLVLAYAGASLPIFLILVMNPSGSPLWLGLNDEIIIEEVVRTLSGSLGLILAVPLTTLLASWYVGVKLADDRVKKSSASHK